ncbi:MAG TPA: DUF302 domain-containing protein [Aggregatilineales bacterium]|nr:DUF302 domain-containing protein [Aggregatilineales bacterium]
MIPTTQSLGLTTTLQVDYATALQRVTDALKTEGFGVLTEIDVKETLKKKLDVDFHPYKILGACNPTLAHRALSAAPEVGLLLPCNVTVSEVEAGRVQVSIIDPLMMMSVVEGAALQPIAQEARERLNRVIAALEA